MERVTLERKNLNAQLYEILEGQIISGELLPGTKLSEERIAEQFGVSRSPARDAIVELERRGLAARAGPRDRTVSIPDETMISETFEVWWILDSARTYLSSLHATADDQQKLLDVLHEMEALGEQPAGARQVALSQEFHDLLTKNTTNSQLDRIIDDYGRYIRWFKALYFEHLDTSESSQLEHRMIVDHYIRRDMQGLMEVIRRHILRQRDAILKHLNAPARIP